MKSLDILNDDARAAMAALIANPKTAFVTDASTVFDEIAATAYRFARAMEAEREKQRYAKPEPKGKNET